MKINNGGTKMNEQLKKRITGFALLASAILLPVDYCLYQKTQQPREAQDDETVRSRACNSSAPLLIMDFFHAGRIDYGDKTKKDRTVDINGDDIPDISHGDMVEKIATKSGTNWIITYNRRGTENYQPASSLASDLEDIEHLIQTGQAPKPAGIILPTEIETRLRLAENAPPPDDLNETRETYGDAVIATNNDRGLSRIRDALRRLRADNVPTFTTAGNGYSPLKLNVIATFGAIAVGAELPGGKGPAPYSNANSMTRIYRQGDYISRAVPGGISISGGDRPDFTSAELSNGPRLAAIFAQLTPQYPNISPTLAYMQSNTWNAALPNLQRYAARYGEWTLTTDGMTFRTSPQGTLVFDPAGNGDPAQVALNKGTSYALPALCRP